MATCLDCGKKLGRPEYKRCVKCNGLKHRGKNNPSYKHGKTKNNKCIDCGKHICHLALRCRSCANKGLNNPLIKAGKIGNKHHNFTGLSSLNKAIRALANYKHWKVEVLTRDEYKCQRCGITTTLEVHHKISVETIIYWFKITNWLDAINCRFLWSVENGQTLCARCHEIVDKCRGKFHV